MVFQDKRVSQRPTMWPCSRLYACHPYDMNVGSSWVAQIMAIGCGDRWKELRKLKIGKGRSFGIEKRAAASFDVRSSALRRLSPITIHNLNLLKKSISLHETYLEIDWSYGTGRFEARMHVSSIITSSQTLWTHFYQSKGPQPRIISSFILEIV